MELGYCITLAFQHGLICHHTITFTAFAVMVVLAGILERCGLFFVCNVSLDSCCRSV